MELTLNSEGIAGASRLLETQFGNFPGFKPPKFFDDIQSNTVLRNTETNGERISQSLIGYSVNTGFIHLGGCNMGVKSIPAPLQAVCNLRGSESDGEPFSEVANRTSEEFSFLLIHTTESFPGRSKNEYWYVYIPQKIRA